MQTREAMNETLGTAVSGSNVAGDPILIIDDDPECCRVAVDLLERAGYRVEWTVDPRFALPRIRERRYAAVVSDVEMPSMRGTDLATEAARVRPPVPTLLVSARTDEDTRASAQALGVGLLRKPFRGETLVRAVRALTGPPADAPAGVDAR
jgi:DNA-binding response OmpR family regulator